MLVNENLEKKDKEKLLEQYLKEKEALIYSLKRGNYRLETRYARLMILENRIIPELIKKMNYF